MVHLDNKVRQVQAIQRNFSDFTCTGENADGGALAIIMNSSYDSVSLSSIRFAASGDPGGSGLASGLLLWCGASFPLSFLSLSDCPFYFTRSASSANQSSFDIVIGDEKGTALKGSPNISRCFSLYGECPILYCPSVSPFTTRAVSWRDGKGECVKGWVHYGIHTAFVDPSVSGVLGEGELCGTEESPAPLSAQHSALNGLVGRWSIQQRWW